MAGCPLRPATDRRFGGPLPRQLPNQTRAHPIPRKLSMQGHAPPHVHAVLAAVSGCYPPVWGRLPTRYSPVRHSVTRPSTPEGFRPRASFDLHVLSTPPAFILSQDQTLMLKCLSRTPGKLAFLVPFPSCHRWQVTVSGCNIRCCSLKEFFSLNLSRLFHCSVLNVHFLFLLSNSLFIISYRMCLVKKFFTFFYFFRIACFSQATRTV